MIKDKKNAIQMMLKKAYEKLKTAEMDYDAGRYDDSVSRVYYAVFHSISAVLLAKGLHYSSHNQTIGAFNKEFIHPDIFPKQFSKYIQKLFNDRQIGDYDFENLIGADTAKEDVAVAKQMIEACERYLRKEAFIDAKASEAQ
jgi:uncharacterized protein (UPF0332 family)